MATTNGTSTEPIKGIDYTTFYNIINGQPSQTSTTRHSINPSTLEANPEVPVSTQDDVDKAVDAAKTAFASWSEVPVEERRKKLHALADALLANADKLAELLVREQGKPVSRVFSESSDDL